MQRKEDAVGKLKVTASQRRRIQTKLWQTRDIRLCHCLLAVLEFDGCTPVSAIAESLGVSCQSVYNWMTRFQNGGDGCEPSDAPRSGRPARAGEVIKVLLHSLLILSLEWFGCYATRWTVPVLRNRLRENTGKSSRQTRYAAGCMSWAMLGSGPATFSYLIRSEKKHQICRALSGSPRWGGCQAELKNIKDRARRCYITSNNQGPDRLPPRPHKIVAFSRFESRRHHRHFMFRSILH